MKIHTHEGWAREAKRFQENQEKEEKQLPQELHDAQIKSLKETDSGSFNLEV